MTENRYSQNSAGQLYTRRVYSGPLLVASPDFFCPPPLKKEMGAYKNSTPDEISFSIGEVGGILVRFDFMPNFFSHSMYLKNKARVIINESPIAVK